MANIDRSSIDLYTINNDYSGTRNMKDNQEFVHFRSDSLHRIWFNEQTECYEEHWHSAMEIMVPIENWYESTINGVPYHIEPGNILIVPSGVIHSITAPPTGQRFIFLMDASIISSIPGYSGLQSLLSAPICLSRDANTQFYDQVYQILVQMRNVYFNNEDFADIKLQALLIHFLLKLTESRNVADEVFPNVRLYKQQEYLQKFNQVLAYIDEHYTENIMLEDIADQAGFSKFHFSRLFKQYTDFTFCDYLNFKRIKEAEKFLGMLDYSITEVALMTGFSSISTFNRLFKKQHNCTPSEYRAKNHSHLGMQIDKP